MIDQFGDVRWTINEEMPAVYGLQQTESGLLVAVAGRDIIEVTLSGIVERYTIPLEYGDIHHDIAPIAENQYLLTVNSTDGETIEDLLILFDTENMTVLREWDLRESVPKMTLLIDDDNDWFHVNAVAFDSRDQTILVSGQRSAVAKISWENELIWLLTDPERLTDVDVSQIKGLEGENIDDVLLLDLYGDIITWGQHDIRIDPNTNSYYLFDNGFGRFYVNSNNYSRGVNFSIDEDALQFDINRTFGQERTEFYSPIISGIDFNSLGDVLVNFGSIGYEFNYLNNKDFRGSIWKSEYAGYGAAWLEFDIENNIKMEILFSGFDGQNNDPGIYRARYGSLSK